MLGNSRLQTIILTAKLAEAERFYSDVLGLHLRERSNGALVYDVNGSDLRISPVEATQPTVHTVVGFAVEDLDATVLECRGRGITWERLPNVPCDGRGIVVTPDGSKVVGFRDPDGNLLSIVQFAV
jgi:catechol 2,3-dioxygenase-like lactoylglutathione lyase family enzyme